jgi:hypothetical protein
MSINVSNGGLVKGGHASTVMEGFKDEGLDVAWRQCVAGTEGPWGDYLLTLEGPVDAVAKAIGDVCDTLTLGDFDFVQKMREERSRGSSYQPWLKRRGGGGDGRGGESGGGGGSRGGGRGGQGKKAKRGR